MLDKILDKIIKNRFACIVLGIICLILAATVFRNYYRSGGLIFIALVLIFPNIIAACITFIFEVIVKIIKFFKSLLENKSALFIFTLVSLFISVFAYYLNIKGIIFKLCPLGTIVCHYIVLKIIQLFEISGFVFSLAGIIFLFPKKTWYYLIEFPNECKRINLIPLIILYIFIILLMPYLFFWVILKPDLSLSNEQFTFYNILLGLLLMVMLGIEIFAFTYLISTCKRLFDKDDIDYKEIGKSKSYSEFLYGEEPEPDRKNDSLLKKDEN